MTLFTFQQEGNMELCKSTILLILIDPCFFNPSLAMKKVCLVICVLVMFSKMVHVNATGTCLATKEKGYYLAILFIYLPLMLLVCNNDISYLIFVHQNLYLRQIKSF
jgi:hypothetical protein